MGDERAIARSNLWLRSADRVLLKMGEFKALEFEDLFQQTHLRSETKKLMGRLDRTLTPREKQIITWRYGLFGSAPMPQRQVAQKLGISRSYVSRIEKKALEKLRDAMEQPETLETENPSEECTKTVSQRNKGVEPKPR